MPRGELVGEAYVRIHADTTFMRRAIKRAAKQDAETYTKDFSNRIEQIADQELKRGRERLARAVAVEDFSEFERQFGSVQKAVRHVREEMDVLNRSNLVYAKDVSVIENALKKWEVKAQVKEDMDRAHEAALRYQKVLDKTEVSAQRLNKQFDLQVRLGEKLATAQDKLEFEKLTTNFEHLRSTVQRDSRERERAIGVLHRHGAEIDDVARALVRQHSAAGRLLTRMGRLNLQFESFGSATGRAFGKGSRNNFVNFVGSAVGGIVTLGLKFGTLIGPITKVGGLIGDMIDQFKVLRGTGSGVGESLVGALGIGLKSGLAGLAALAGALIVLGTLLPLVAAGFSLLAGALTAVAGAITIGVLGGLLPLVPVLAALGTGLGAVALAFTNMAGKSKTAVANMKPLKDAWKQLQKDMLPVAKQGTKELISWVRLLRDASPFLSDMARSMLTFFSELRTGLKSKEMKPFLDQFRTVLPIIGDNLSHGISQLSQALIKFFAPIADWGEILSAKFEDLMTRFNEWAGSAKGQNSIKDFMSDAWRAASDLWDILTNVTSIIADLFNVGNKEGGGQSFLDYLKDLTDRFDKFLKSPEGKTAVKDFFIDVKGFMQEAKNVLEGLARTFDELDTPEARQAFVSITGAVVDLSNAIADVIGWANRYQLVLGLLSDPSQAITSALGLLAGAFDITTSAGQRTWAVMGTLRSIWIDLQLVATNMALFSVTAFQNVLAAALLWVSGMLDAAIRAFGWVPVLGDRLRTAKAGVDAFSAGTNAALDRIKTDLEIQVHTLQAQQAVSALAAKINSIRDKSVVITAVGRFANAGVLSNGGRGTGGGPTFARGTIATKPTQGTFGEAGAEALVPLDRPLSQVDPSVRWLSAIAQGKHYAGGGLFSPGTTIMPGAIVVHTTKADPRLVASSVLDRIAASAR